jgi:hypothetical protein
VGITRINLIVPIFFMLNSYNRGTPPTAEKSRVAPEK